MMSQNRLKSIKMLEFGVPTAAELWNEVDTTCSNALIVLAC